MKYDLIIRQTLRPQGRYTMLTFRLWSDGWLVGGSSSLLPNHVFPPYKSRTFTATGHYKLPS